MAHFGAGHGPFWVPSTLPKTNAFTLKDGDWETIFFWNGKISGAMSVLGRVTVLRKVKSEVLIDSEMQLLNILMQFGPRFEGIVMMPTKQPKPSCRCMLLGIRMPLQPQPLWRHGLEVQSVS